MWLKFGSIAKTPSLMLKNNIYKPRDRIEEKKKVEARVMVAYIRI